MRSFVYGAKIERGDRSGLVVSFPDVPEAITQGDDMADALAMAEDALGLALLTYAERGLALPRSKARQKGLVPVTVEPGVAAKLAVLEAFRGAHISKAELARRLGRNEKEVRRILDPRHATKLTTLTEALNVLGHRLVVSMERAA